MPRNYLLIPLNTLLFITFFAMRSSGSPNPNFFMASASLPLRSELGGHSEFYKQLRSLIFEPLCPHALYCPPYEHINCKVQQVYLRGRGVNNIGILTIQDENYCSEIQYRFLIEKARFFFHFPIFHFCHG